MFSGLNWGLGIKRLLPIEYKAAWTVQVAEHNPLKQVTYPTPIACPLNEIHANSSPRW
jgi:hypothetical protein